MPLTDVRHSLAPYRPIALDDLRRVGRDHDGGYVISHRTIAAARVLVGLGINDDWSFEAEFARLHPAVRVIGVDGSVSPGTFRRRAATEARRALLGLLRGRRWAVAKHLPQAREALALSRDMRRFFAPPHRFLSRFVDVADGPTAVCWASLAALAGPTTGDAPDLFVKMDVEGAEYGVLPHLLADAPRIAGMAVEFHDCGIQWPRLTALLEALDAHFAIAHVHGNNYAPLIAGSRTPEVLEFTFVNRRLLDGPPEPSRASYPRPELDMPNAVEWGDYVLEM